MAGTAETLRASDTVPDSRKKRAVAGQKAAREDANKKRRNVFAEAGFSPAKACKVLKEGKLQGKDITDKQRGALGALCDQKGK